MKHYLMKETETELELNEQEQLELFELFADLQEAIAKTEVLRGERDRAEEARWEQHKVQTKIECRIGDIRERARLREVEALGLEIGTKYELQGHPEFDMIKIDGLEAWNGRAPKIRFSGRRGATKGWLRKTFETDIQGIQELITNQ